MVKKPRTNKYMYFRSCMKLTENNVCLSWILMRGRGIVHFASDQLVERLLRVQEVASSILGCAIPKALKMVLAAPLLVLT